MASTDARPVPEKNVAYRAYFGIFKSDGTLITSAAGLDSEVSKDGAAIADCTNEATEIGATGLYYLDLTSTEMNADSVIVLVKSSSTGAVPVVLSLYPQESGDILVNVQGFTIPVGPIPALGIIENGLLQSATSSSIIVFRAGTTLGDDVVNNAVVEVVAGTGIGQTRLLVDFTGATDTGTVDPAFSVTLDNTSHVIIRAAPPAPTTAAYVPAVNMLTIEGTDATDVLATLDDAVLTQVAAVLAMLDSARGEPGQGAPPVNPDAMTKLDYLYKAFRNRSTQTATEYALYADDATTKDHEAVCSDDGTTFVRGELATGA